MTSPRLIVIVVDVQWRLDIIAVIASKRPASGNKSSITMMDEIDETLSERER